MTPLVPTVLGVAVDTWKGILLGMGGIGALIGSVQMYYRKNRIDGAKTNLDVDALQAGTTMIQNLQTDIANLRKTMIEADTKWRADMDKLEARLRDMSDQVDAAIVARRAAEEKVARLRYQLQQLGQTPVE